jgi:signal transduction histidine kinase
MDIFDSSFDSDGFMPHGHCYLWTPTLLWINVVSDFLISLAYISIPITLIYFVQKRRDIPFNWMFICFGMFILACGGTHIMDIWTTWNPSYWLSGYVKAITAAASVPTAILLTQLVPKALLIPSPQKLAIVNAELQKEIAERKRVEQTLQTRNNELAAANEVRGRFLAAMSHELRTPLNAIIGFTGTLLMSLPGPLNADQEKQLRLVQGGGKHLLALINDLLDLAKIDAGKVELRLETMEIRRVIEEIAASLRPFAERKGLKLFVAESTEEIVVRTDRRTLSQIVLNLINNAIKFTEIGSVRLDVARRTEDGNGVVEIAVQDTGVGIRVEDQPKLFEAFAQVGATTKQPEEGTGLGLHLSQKLALLLGGVISMRSEYGKGSTFALTLTEARWQ